MTSPGTKKFKVTKDTSHEISPAMVGQISVQIEISWLQKGKEHHVNAGFLLASGSVLLRVSWHVVAFPSYTISMTLNPRIPPTAHHNSLTKHLPLTLRIATIVFPVLQGQQLSLRLTGC